VKISTVEEYASAELSRNESVSAFSISLPYGVLPNPSEYQSHLS
jgi:hypothetical protein